MDFKLARMDSIVAVVLFAESQVEVRHRGNSVLEGFVDACDFKILFFEKMGTPPSFP